MEKKITILIITTLLCVHIIPVSGILVNLNNNLIVQNAYDFNDPRQPPPPGDIPEGFVFPEIPENEIKIFYPPELSSHYGNTAIVDMIQSVSYDMILGYLEDITSFGPRVTGSSASFEAGEYLYTMFESMDLDVSYHYWSYWGYNDRNVVATLPGSDCESDQIFIVCAHFDSVPGSPGADDDGSGVAAVLACASLMSQYNFCHTIRFIGFSGEEQGLLGSHEYAKQAALSGDNIIGVLNADMIGYAVSQSDGERIKIFSNSASQWLLSFTQAVNQVYSEYLHLDIYPQGPSYNSDHASFWQYGYDAIFYHEYTFNPYYHSPQDTIENMNVSYNVKTTKLILATLAELAQVQQIVLQGNCFYQNMNPVDPVTVEIINLDTNTQWDAYSEENYYVLLLQSNDIAEGQTLRFIARDTDESINVTDYVITADDITAGIITQDLLLDIHYRDLKSFPHTIVHIDTGAAVMKMMLDFLMWNNTLFDEPQSVYSEQDLYDAYAGGDHINASEMCLGLRLEIDDRNATPPWSYGYFFNTRYDDDALEVLRSICIWLDYDISGHNDIRSVDVPKIGHPYHVPVAVPTGGNYENWMVIRGIHTNRSLWDISNPGYHQLIAGPVSMYGFWLTDPSSSGLGGSTYVTSQYFTEAYFERLDVAGDVFDGKYVAVVDPPEHIPVDTACLAVTMDPPVSGFTSSEEKLISFTRRGLMPVSHIAHTLYVEKAFSFVQNVLQYDLTLSILIGDMTASGRIQYDGNSVIVNLGNESIQVIVYLSINGEPQQFKIK